MSKHRVEVSQTIDEALEPIAAANFRTKAAARAHFEKARACFASDEGAHVCDLLVDDDLVDTFRMDDITGMTGFLPKERLTTLAEYRAMAVGAQDPNPAHKAR